MKITSKKNLKNEDNLKKKMKATSQKRQPQKMKKQDDFKKNEIKTTFKK